jgi:hypothetical protein
MSPRSTFHSWDGGQLGLRPADELLAEVLADALLGAGGQRAELQHHEEVAAAPDAGPAVEDGAAARDEQQQRERECDRRHQDRDRRGEDQVERAQLDVDPAVGGLASESRVAADEGVLEARRRRCHARDGRPWP